LPNGYDHSKVATPRLPTDALFGKGRFEADAVSVLLFE